MVQINLWSLRSRQHFLALTLTFTKQNKSQENEDTYARLTDTHWWVGAPSRLKHLHHYLHQYGWLENNQREIIDIHTAMSDRSEERVAIITTIIITIGRPWVFTNVHSFRYANGLCRGGANTVALIATCLMSAHYLFLLTVWKRDGNWGEQQLKQYCKQFAETSVDVKVVVSSSGCTLLTYHFVLLDKDVSLNVSAGLQRRWHGKLPIYRTFV